ncbi:hypothetical protein [Xylella fastidiosa]|uniref:Uncharacterized protein n=1 Tax=Xylella fastidiosa subsp. multiplex TaxID=644357 RepID=A0AAW6HUJ9_XYLFS|nr:hypothetical protein [Xylella fastidiosa]KFA42028.1 hypothetical protein DF22_001386 [Xylella fastidiosa]MCP8325594.1 hypothetical protein [Xylella fastidiosa subsp. multiplex]MDC6408316.1 hypothetical protein [Xylella fastidiosa subsp. multiplex]MDD0909766.1 hypothetical protein [Xylella fastidiosa subsp. multiplex]MDD0929847.1 hypothetical protein [Xylella fastidiosa subsp. multiplex]
MNNTFNHKFSDDLTATVRHWIHPGGSEGRIVATSAKVHPSVVIKKGVVIFPNAIIPYATSAFRNLWCRLHGEWLPNTWVWVIQFERIELRTHVCLNTAKNDSVMEVA